MSFFQNKTNYIAGTLLGFLLAPAVAAAGRPDAKAFLQEKDEIRLLAAEELRDAVDYNPRTLFSAESRLRALHEEFQVAGGTPPTRLDGDLAELRGACQRAQRLAATKPPPPNPAAQEIIARHWERYRADFDGLRTRLEQDKSAGRAESQIYWDGRRSFDALKESVSQRLLFNAPPKETSLAAAFFRDEETLLMACEIPPKKTRGKTVPVFLPRDHATATPIDVQAFYRSLDKVPEARALRVGAFTVPPGTRTVTLRDGTAQLVFRPVAGNGMAYLGQSEQEIHYGYLAIPPDTAYYFENIGTKPLEIEYVGIKP
jgi:hypothetical protein